jgi:hypothetical protein
MLAEQDQRFWPNAVAAGYYIVGLPVAWWHMRRENITKADVPDSPGNRRFWWFILILAVLWPVLLLAIGAAWLSNRLDGPPKKKG